MEISTFQDAGHNLNTVNSALIMNYDELNKFTGSLTYSIQRFIFFCHGTKGGEGAWHNGSPINTLLVNWIIEHSSDEVKQIIEHSSDKVNQIIENSSNEATKSLILFWWGQPNHWYSSDEVNQIIEHSFDKVN